jgi:hypothetical protein
MRVSGAEPGLKGLRIGLVSMTRIIGSGAWEPRQARACRGSSFESHRLIHRFIHHFVGSMVFFDSR